MALEDGADVAATEVASEVDREKAAAGTCMACPRLRQHPRLWQPYCETGHPGDDTPLLRRDDRHCVFPAATLIEADAD